MRASFLAFFLLASCFNSTVDLIAEGAVLVFGDNTQKEKRKIGSLKKKLESLEKEKEEALEGAEKLKNEIYQAELALVRQQVDEYEQKLEKLNSEEFLDIDPAILFLSERQTLHQIIRSSPSQAAFQAQIELDRILRLITELSSDNSFKY